MIVSMKKAMDKRRNHGRTGEKNPTLFILVLLIFLLWSSFASARNGRAQSPFQVGLVVQFNDTTITRCVTLNKDNPTGYDVLTAADLDLITSTSGMGVTVCSIQGVGCPASDCFCKSYAYPFYYWSYWHLQNGAWVYSNLGVSNYKVSPQSVEGWIWGDGKNPPPNFSFAALCSTATPTVTMSATAILPTPTVTWSATATPRTPIVYSATPTIKFSVTANPANLFTNTPSITSFQKTRKPSATSPISITPFLTSTPIPPTNNSPSQNSATATISPTPTITLAYAVQAQASSTPNPSHLSPIPPSPTESYNLGALSLTATAIALSRQLTSTPTLASIALSPLIKTGFLAFLGMLGGLLLLFIILLLRLRR